ncbi:hypothetical protein H4582DRAFT_128139 [Lactarius indigo]|nr:hypothetical protein H4582DRAFT_128139 [Lactarius indigo]
MIKCGTTTCVFVISYLSLTVSVYCKRWRMQVVRVERDRSGPPSLPHRARMWWPAITPIALRLSHHVRLFPTRFLPIFDPMPSQPKIIPGG